MFRWIILNLCFGAIKKGRQNSYAEIHMYEIAWHRAGKVIPKQFTPIISINISIFKHTKTRIAWLTILEDI